MTALNIRRLLPMMLFLALMGGVFAQGRTELLRPRVGYNRTHLLPGGGRRAIVKKTELTVPEAAVPPAATKGHYTFATLYEDDTIPLYFLKEVDVWGSYLLLTDKEIKKNTKLIRNVKLMLPYAREAKRRLDVLEVEVAKMTPKERKKALKQAEKDIEAEYKKDLKKRTYSQGLVLIKLIDRETSRSAYTLVKDLRGSVRAGLYQACAWLFGYNLKDKFDPSKNSKDDLIDRIVKSVDKGYL